MDRSERLDPRDTPAPGEDPELAPAEIPSSTPDSKTDSTTTGWLPRLAGGRIGNRLANVSWRSRMRWLDDGGR